MELNSTTKLQYQDQGFLFYSEFLDKSFMASLNSHLDELLQMDHPGNVYEQDQKTLRAVHGSHQHNAAMASLVRHPKILKPVEALLGSEVYVHQFKVNIKAAFSGDKWPWHQDYIFWKHEDGMPTPRVVNVILFADEVSQFNGPFCLIPSSHKNGCIEVPAQPATGDWEDNFSSNLKFSIDQEYVRELWGENGATSPIGPAGSVLFFDANLVHASSNNISPFDRKLIIITYNSIDNIPQNPGKQRPEFLISKDYRPLRAWGINDAEKSFFD